MGRIKFRPFWSYDVLKTEEWLNQLRENGLKLVKINTFLRLFHFEECESKHVQHIIGYTKNSNGYPKNIVSSSEYNEVCYTTHFYVVEKVIDEPEFTPSYSMLLARNHKIKHVVGQILLFIIILGGLTTIPLSLILLFSSQSSVEYNVVDVNSAKSEMLEVVFYILFQVSLLLSYVWMIFTYFTLRKTNKKLEKLCGENIDLSFTIPKNTILSPKEIKQLKRENKLIKKTRIAWGYSLDKTEQWLEGMEKKGYHLLRMSKVGNSFYFVLGEKRNVAYHIDFQKRKESDYYTVHEESGWCLYFTSFSRFQSFSVWNQEYDVIKPEFYSDYESKVKHAKSLMVSYLIIYLPLLVFYSFVVGRIISTWIKSIYESNLIPVSMMFASSMMILLLLEYLWFVFRIIRYYHRVKDQVKEEVI